MALKASRLSPSPSAPVLIRPWSAIVSARWKAFAAVGPNVRFVFPLYPKRVEEVCTALNSAFLAGSSGKAELVEALARAVSHHQIRCDLAERMGATPPKSESWVADARSALALAKGGG